MQQQPYAKKGFVTMFSLIILMVISISIFSSILLVNVDSLKSIQAIRNGIIARANADSCVEIALNKLKMDDLYIGEESIELLEGSCEILAIQGSGNYDLVLRTKGYSGDAVKKMEVLIAEVNPEIILDKYIETDL